MKLYQHLYDIFSLKRLHLTLPENIDGVEYIRCQQSTLVVFKNAKKQLVTKIINHEVIYQVTNGKF